MCRCLLLGTLEHRNFVEEAESLILKLKNSLIESDLAGERGERRIQASALLSVLVEGLDKLNVEEAQQALGLIAEMGGCRLSSYCKEGALEDLRSAFSAFCHESQVKSLGQKCFNHMGFGIHVSEEPLTFNAMPYVEYEETYK